MGTIILLALGILGLGTCKASIHDYKDQSFSVRGNALFFHGGNEGVYASNLSFIRFDEVRFVRNATQSVSGMVEAVILEVKDRNRIGGFLPGSDDAICCTPDFAATGACTMGEIIFRKDSDDPEWPRRIKTLFGGNQTEARMSPEAVVVNKTAMYELYFLICEPELQGTIIRGRSVWKGPSGYLPGKMAPLLNFFGYMSLAYVLLGLLWLLRFLQIGKVKTQLQHQITLLIALGMIEMGVHYIEYASFNKTGTRPKEVTAWAVTFTSARRAISRLLLLLVSMGYGVLKPTLDGFTPRRLLLAAVYFLATEAVELDEHLGKIDDFSLGKFEFLAIPLAVLDVCLIVWIFISLARTLDILKVRYMAELKLFVKFTNTLALAVLLSVVWMGFELYSDAKDPLSKQWQMAWTFTAFWSLHSYCVLVVVCILWDPSKNPTRVSYSEVEMS